MNISYNSRWGIEDLGWTNSFYNNYLFNANNVRGLSFWDKPEDYWNTTKVAGKNIIGGNWIGGNFWGRPAGEGAFSQKGYSQTCEDSNSDGICDEPYKVKDFDEGVDWVDHYPLTY